MVKYEYSCSVGQNHGTDSHVISIDRVLPNSKSIPQGLKISFKRTIRVPDKDMINNLPPNLGTFAIHKIQDYAARLPDAMVEKGGVFLSM